MAQRLALGIHLVGVQFDRRVQRRHASRIGDVGICAALLSLLAQRYGLSSWYGALILFIPGFWQSAALTLPEPLTLAFVLGGLLAVARQRWVIAGLCLGMAMLVRETGGAIVLAIPAGIFLAGQRRAALVVFALAFTPVVLWKLYLGWIFYPVYGLQALTPHPDDVGLPFQGIWEMGTKIWSGAFVGQGEHVRSGILCAILSTGAAALAADSFFVSRRVRSISTLDPGATRMSCSC